MEAMASKSAFRWVVMTSRVRAGAGRFRFMAGDAPSYGSPGGGWRPGGYRSGWWPDPRGPGAVAAPGDWPPGKGDGWQRSGAGYGGSNPGPRPSRHIASESSRSPGGTA